MIKLRKATRERRARRVQKLIRDLDKKTNTGGRKIRVHNGILLAALRNVVYPLSEPKGELDILKMLLLRKVHEYNDEWLMPRALTVRRILDVTTFTKGDYRGENKDIASIFPKRYDPKFDLLEFNRLIRMYMFPLRAPFWWWEHLESCKIYFKDGTSMPLKTYVINYTRIDIAQSLSNAKVKLPDELSMLITRYLFK